MAIALGHKVTSDEAASPSPLTSDGVRDGMSSHSPTNSSQKPRRDIPRHRPPSQAAVCSALDSYSRSAEQAPLAMEIGEVSRLCRPFVGASRRRLDRCGDAHDPYSSLTSRGHDSSEELGDLEAPSKASQSRFSWASRSELARRGKINLFLDRDGARERQNLMSRIADLKEQASQLCCGHDDPACRSEFSRVEISLCEPNPDANAPDPCAFGGTFRYPAAGYETVFSRLKTRALEASERDQKFGMNADVRAVLAIAEKNLVHRPSLEVAATASASSLPGSIVLSSYVSEKVGGRSLEPVILHEFGHACSMARMRQWALEIDKDPAKSLRAANWLDQARARCDRQWQIPSAYEDFWIALGETRELAQCLERITQLNHQGKVDGHCPNLCPGHYIEESVGIGFSLLLGDLDGSPGSVFPTTCDHVRDGQHPMVSDVVDCFARHSSRFQSRIGMIYGCSAMIKNDSH